MAEKSMSKEEIIEGFNKLRMEQRSIAVKIAELESDKGEHNLVIQALSEVDQDRKCFRFVGDVLVERKVADVLPALKSHKEKLDAATKGLQEKLSEKGVEMNAYREKHGITVRGEGAPGGVKEVPKANDQAATKPGQSSGVLVSD